MTNDKWTNYNDAADQVYYELIPSGTVAKVKTLVKYGGYITDEFKDGWATKSKTSNAVYLALEFIINEGKYEGRRIWQNIGLYSENSDKYGAIGRGIIKGILNSAHDLHPADKSPQAAKQREIKTFGDLNDLDILAEIIVNSAGKNEIRVIQPNDERYKDLMHKKNITSKVDYQAISKNSGFIDDHIPF